MERVIKDHPDVADCAAVGEEPEPGKVVVAAYVIPRPDSALTTEAVAAHARDHLASYKAPRLVYLVDDLPRTRNGKILRRELRPPMFRT